MPLSGQLQQTDFFENVGGVNLVDTPFRVKDNQSVGGFNLDYHTVGGIRKRLGNSTLNTVADAQKTTLGLAVYAPAAGTSKSIMRIAGTAFQYVDSAYAFHTLTDDTAGAGSTPFPGTSTLPARMTQFSTPGNDIMWAAGAGLTLPIGAYSTTNYTQNGVPTVTGTLGASRTSGSGGTWGSNNFGLFGYALVLRKRSTQALSNAYLDCSGTTSTATDEVTVTWSLPSLDTTLYDQIWIYRSSLVIPPSVVTSTNPASGFTAGQLIAQVTAATSGTFVDKGPIGNPDVLTSQVVPRAGSEILDNSVLPAATYNCMTLFKHRLVVASGSSLYLSEVNNSESWPLTNYIDVQSAGPITGLAVISFTSPQAQSLQEILVIFKERELWVLTGDAFQSDSSGAVGWGLQFIDDDGCTNQDLVVLANGFITWVGYRGIYLWDGTSKPIYCSRPLEPLFSKDGDLNTSFFSQGTADFYRKENQVIWFLSHKTYGAQVFAVKMDLRLTLPMIEQTMTGRNIDAVFALDILTQPVYSCASYIPANSSEERLIVGDASGFLYQAYNSNGDAGSNFPFTYLTKCLNCGDPNVVKQFQRVIVWVSDSGNYPLFLDYWTNYKQGAAYQATLELPIETGEVPTGSLYALWDVAVWDQSDYDTRPPSLGAIKPLIFNLTAGVANNAEGTALQLQFRNGTANQPLTIHGFSVQWNPLGGIS